MSGLRDTREDVDASWKDQHGAFVGTPHGDPEVVAPAIALALKDLGYRRPDPGEATSLSVQHLACERGAWAVAWIDRATARGLAVRLAARSAETVWLLAARATYRENVRPACLFEASEASVGPDGRFGAVPSPVLEGVSFSERELETDHPWRLVELALDVAIDRWAPRHESLPRTEWLTPPALADARLEGIARQIRAGARVEHVMVTNRRALRVKRIDGTVATAFLSDDELRALADALPGFPLRS